MWPFEKKYGMRSGKEIRARLAMCNEVLDDPSAPESAKQIQTKRKAILVWILTPMKSEGEMRTKLAEAQKVLNDSADFDSRNSAATNKVMLEWALGDWGR